MNEQRKAAKCRKGYSWLGSRDRDTWESWPCSRTRGLLVLQPIQTDPATLCFSFLNPVRSLYTLGRYLYPLSTSGLMRLTVTGTQTAKRKLFMLNQLQPVTRSVTWMCGSFLALLYQLIMTTLDTFFCSFYVSVSLIDKNSIISYGALPLTSHFLYIILWSFKKFLEYRKRIFIHLLETFPRFHS